MAKAHIACGKVS